MKIIYITVLLFSFVSITSCQNDFDPDYWFQVGEVNLESKDLIISIPNEVASLDSIFLFYVEPNNHSSSDKYYGLMIAYDGEVLHLVETTESGGWGDLLYGTEDVSRDDKCHYLVIPNRFLFKSKMRLWSALKSEVIVNGMILPAKKTTKIDKNDPYRFILLSK